MQSTNKHSSKHFWHDNSFLIFVHSIHLSVKTFLYHLIFFVIFVKGFAPSEEISNLDPGTYYVSVRPVDSNCRRRIRVFEHFTIP